MSDTFRELAPAELQSTLLQFMGQNMGELKKLDSSLIDKNNTLRGMTLDPDAVMKSIPRPVMPQQAHAPAPAQITNIPVTTQPVAVQVNTQQVQEDTDENQLVFNFIKDIRAQPSVIDTIDSTYKKILLVSDTVYSLDKRLKAIEDMLTSSQQDNNIKKKNQETP
jgi:hypothetical protein